MKSIIFLAGLLLGAAGAWYATASVLSTNPQYVKSCEANAFGIMEAEKIISKISADYENDMNAERRSNALCAVRGKLPPGKSTSTVWIPDWGWDGERWLKQVESGAYLFSSK